MALNLKLFKKNKALTAGYILASLISLGIGIGLAISGIGIPIAALLIVFGAGAILGLFALAFLTSETQYFSNKTTIISHEESHGCINSPNHHYSAERVLQSHNRQKNELARNNQEEPVDTWFSGWTSFFKNDELEKRRYAYESYSETVKMQTEELQDINIALASINEQYDALNSDIIARIEKIFPTIKDFMPDSGSITSKQSEEEDRQLSATIQSLSNSYPSLLEEIDYTSEEILEIERQRIEHHTELKAITEHYIIKHIHLVEQARAEHSTTNMQF